MEGWTRFAERKERREGFREEEKETEGGNMRCPNPAPCWERRGRRWRPSKSASLLSTPPTSSPPGASEATELRITNGRHWPGKKL